MLLPVAHVVKEGGGEEVTRIISVRNADRKEGNSHEETSSLVVRNPF